MSLLALTHKLEKIDTILESLNSNGALINTIKEAAADAFSLEWDTYGFGTWGTDLVDTGLLRSKFVNSNNINVFITSEMIYIEPNNLPSYEPYINEKYGLYNISSVDEKILPVIRSLIHNALEGK